METPIKWKMDVIYPRNGILCGSKKELNSNVYDSQKHAEQKQTQRLRTVSIYRSSKRTKAVHGDRIHNQWLPVVRGVWGIELEGIKRELSGMKELFHADRALVTQV